MNVQREKQVIIGITIKDRDTRTAIKNLGKGNYNMIRINEKAFVPIIKEMSNSDKGEDSPT